MSIDKNLIQSNLSIMDISLTIYRFSKKISHNFKFKIIAKIYVIKLIKETY